MQKYNLHEICKLLKLPYNCIEDNDISRLDYLISNLHLLTGSVLIGYRDIENIDGVYKIIYNPAQILNEQTHIGVASCLNVEDLKQYVNNTILTIYKYHL